MELVGEYYHHETEADAVAVMTEVQSSSRLKGLGDGGKLGFLWRKITE